ncbi:MAG: fimbrillin family protein [Bacteroidales bacterium]|nr:fimbrillin family protein [Bacteroidales bacterium]
MSKNTLWLGVAAMLTLTTACTSNDDYSTWGDAKEVTFNAAISGTPTVRVSGTSWDANDVIGVYMMPAGQGLNAATASNVKFVTTGGGTFTAEGTPLYYPTEGAVDFVAYYPYSLTLDATGKVSVSVVDQTNPTAIDLLYAKTPAATATGATELTFKHQLAKASYNVTASAGVSLAGLKVVLKAAPTMATFDLATGMFAEAGATADIPLQVAADGSKVEGIVLPGALPAGATLEFTLADGTVKTVDMAGKTFAAGTITSAPVTIKKAGEDVQVNVGFNATITDWTTTPGGSIDITIDGTTPTPPTPPTPDPSPNPNPGTNPAPGTVIFNEEFGGQTIAKVGTHFPSLDIYKDWTSGLTFSDPIMAEKSFKYSNVSIRSTSKLNAHAWFAANKDGAMLITGFKAAGTGTYVLTYDITHNGDGAQDQAAITVFAGDTQLTVPAGTITQKNIYQTVTIAGIPAAQLTNIKFVGSTATNTVGYRIDNVKLTAE